MCETRRSEESAASTFAIDDEATAIVAPAIGSPRPGRVRRGTARRIGLVGLLAAGLVFVAAVPSGSAEERDPAPPRDGVVETPVEAVLIAYLDAEGYRPERTPAGNITFRRGGGVYLIALRPDDPAYFDLSLRYRAPDDESAELRARRIAAANDATAAIKVAKVYIDASGDLVCAVELFLPNPKRVTRVFPRILGAIEAADRKYDEKMVAP